MPNRLEVRVELASLRQLNLTRTTFDLSITTSRFSAVTTLKYRKSALANWAPALLEMHLLSQARENVDKRCGSSCFTATLETLFWLVSSKFYWKSLLSLEVLHIESSVLLLENQCYQQIVGFDPTFFVQLYVLKLVT